MASTYSIKKNFLTKINNSEWDQFPTEQRSILSGGCAQLNFDRHYRKQIVAIFFERQAAAVTEIRPFCVTGIRIYKNASRDRKRTFTALLWENFPDPRQAKFPIRSVLYELS